MKQVWYYETALGTVGIGEENGRITDLFFGRGVPEGECREEETPLIARAGEELGEYLAGRRKTFDLPLAPSGTPFQHQVWKALEEIPYGETRSYGQLAAAIGRPGAARAVGQANHRNPISIFIPCHRVIGGDGSLTGYGGGMDIKEFLLRLEGVL